MQEPVNLVKIIKASAGSGKTYQLALNYLKILSGHSPDISVLRSIVAMTFTNKAAAEMKYRILKFLKEIALETSEGRKLSSMTGISSKDAAKWLDIILRNYEDFRVQTIDSFVFNLLRAMAWEINIRPDVEPEFNTKRIIEKVFDILLLKLGDEKGGDLEKVFKEALNCFLEIERTPGFNPEKHFKKRLGQLFEITARRNFRIISQSNSDSLDQIEKNISELIENILNSNEPEGKFQKKAIDALKNKNFDSAFFHKDHIRDLLLKNKSVEKLSCRELEYLNSLYQNLKRELNEYFLQLAIARMAPYTKLLSKFESEAEKFCNREGIIPAGRWLYLVERHISKGNLPYIYFILGEKFKHFLIDEFQDTSLTQWKVLAPLVDNALSEGGSFLYVGDPKQSIYMWRGANPDIFIGVTEEFTKFRPCIEVLDTNWRSVKKVVEFNNDLFSSLESVSLVEELIKDYIGGSISDVDKDILERCLEDILVSFEDVRQKVSSGNFQDRMGGSVELLKISGSVSEVRNDNIRKSLVEKIKKLAEDGMNLSDMTILVRTNSQAKMVFSWLWNEGITAVTEHSLKLEKAPTVMAIVNFLRFLNDPEDEISLFGFLSSKLAGEFLDEFSEELILKARDQNLSLYRFLRDYRGNIYDKLFGRFIETAGYETAYVVTWKLIEYFDVKKRFPEEISFVLRFLELISGMEERLGRFVSISEFISMWEDEGLEERLGIPEGTGASLLEEGSDRLRGAVRIMTIHGAKGLEFPIVFVPFLDWHLKSSPFVVLDNGEIAKISRHCPKEIRNIVLKDRLNGLVESLNLFYVALTRAKNHLIIMVPESPSQQLGNIFRKIIANQAMIQEKGLCRAN